MEFCKTGCSTGAYRERQQRNLAAGSHFLVWSGLPGAVILWQFAQGVRTNACKRARTRNQAIPRTWLNCRPAFVASDKLDSMFVEMRHRVNLQHHRKMDENA